MSITSVIRGCFLGVTLILSSSSAISQPTIPGPGPRPGGGPGVDAPDLAGTAPQLAVGRFGGCNYKSFTDITNRLGKPCQIFGQLHRGAGLDPRIPIEITAEREGEAFLLKGGQTGISNTFTADIPPGGTVRFYFARPSGVQGFTTNALTIFPQCQSGLLYQSGYEIDCASFDDSFTYPFSLNKFIPLGSCAVAPIHPRQYTPRSPSSDRPITQSTRL